MSDRVGFGQLGRKVERSWKGGVRTTHAALIDLEVLVAVGVGELAPLLVGLVVRHGGRHVCR